MKRYEGRPDPILKCRFVADVLPLFPAAQSTMSCEALDVWHVALGATLGIAVLRWFRHSPRPSTIDHGKAYRETLDFRHRLRATELGIAGGPGGDLDALFADLPVRAPPGPASAGGSGPTAGNQYYSPTHNKHPTNEGKHRLTPYLFIYCFSSVPE